MGVRCQGFSKRGVYCPPECICDIILVGVVAYRDCNRQFAQREDFVPADCAWCDLQWQQVAVVVSQGSDEAWPGY